jgi:hypothetical protein
MKVVIVYFKQSGKYYTSGDYETQREHIFQIADEVRAKFAAGDYPGLVGPCPEYHASVHVPEHPYDVPFLIPARVADVAELRLCESEQLGLHPNQLYRFTVDPKCARCVALAALATQTL